MATKKAKEDLDDTIIEQIEPIDQLEHQVSQLKLAIVKFHILGTQTLIMNRMSEKARLTILAPKSDKANRAERASTPKHDPLFEFRSSTYRNRNEKDPTLFHLPSGCFKKCLAQAAVDVPGSTKAAVGRLVSAVSTQINFYGIPQLGMAVVRSSGQNRVPDVRTRAYFPHWACEVQFRYVRNLITERLIFELLSYAGWIVGVGDWRPEKGSGSHGQFIVVHKDTPEFAEWSAITKTMGRESQLEAYNDPDYYDEDTSDMMTWYLEEMQRREQEEKTTSPRPRRSPPPRGQRMLPSLNQNGGGA